MGANHSLAEMTKMIEADSLGFLSVDGLVSAINLPYYGDGTGLTTAYFDGHYPSPIYDYQAGLAAFVARREVDFAPEPTTTYHPHQKAGVDIKAGEEAVNLMQDEVAKTYNDNVLSGIGGFGAAYALGTNYKDPVLISGADGVGTKLLLAIAANKHDTIGQDLVGMVANDILAQGAKPAFMLDYLAVDKMRPEVVAEIVQGIAHAAKESGMALIGGESAELPGLYAKNHYDLAAFAVV
ncbi:hypothetical protein Pfo_030999 [Paulownia fortunei]|nr:hypothetical protein Pfo_030999 [Paulownia fortunei]